MYLPIVPCTVYC